MALFNNTTTIIIPMYPPQLIPGCILLIIAIFSVPCFIFILYHFLTTGTLYRILINHVIILLLISNGVQTVTDVPLHLGFYFTGIDESPTTPYCIFYNFIDYYLYTTSYLLVTSASFERHIFIFHSQSYNTPFKRLMRHYVPLSFCCVYPFVYYIVFLIFYPCTNYSDVPVSNCVPACYLSSSNVMALYEQTAHGYAPALLALILDTSLIFRVVRQKSRMNRQVTWAKNRKMAIQVLSISFLFLSTNGGYFLIQLGQLLWDPNFGADAAIWINPLSLCMPPLMSYACLPNLPNVKQKFKRLILYGRRTAVVPANAIEIRPHRLGNL